VHCRNAFPAQAVSYGGKLYYNRGGICWRPQVKGLTTMVNSIFNSWRMEDVWLDK